MNAFEMRVIQFKKQLIMRFTIRISLKNIQANELKQVQLVNGKKK